MSSKSILKKPTFEKKANKQVKLESHKEEEAQSKAVQFDLNVTEHKIVSQSSSVSHKHGNTVKADDFSACTLILKNKENQEEFLFFTR